MKMRDGYDLSRKTIAVLVLLIVPITLGVVVFSSLREYLSCQAFEGEIESLIIDYSTKRLSLLEENYRLIDEGFQEPMKGILLSLGDEYDRVSGNWEKLSLQRLVEEAGWPGDLYVINEEGLVIEATDSTEMGLDFSLYQVFFRRLERIRAAGTFTADRIQWERAGNTVRKSAFLSTSDQRYVMEARLEPEGLDTYIGSSWYSGLCREIEDLHPIVRHAVIFNDHYQGMSPLENPATDRQRAAIRESLDAEKNQILQLRGGIREIYIPVILRWDRYPKSLGHVILVEVQQEGLVSFLQKRMGYYLFLILILWIILGAAVWLFRKSITHPLSRLEQAMGEMKQGKRGVRLKTEGRDEMSRLFSRFNAIAVKSDAQGSRFQFLESMYNSLIESVIMLHLGEDGYNQVAQANPAACQMLGYSEESLKGLPLEQILAEDRTGKGFLLREILEKGMIQGQKAVLRSRDGNRLPVILSAVLMEGDENQKSSQGGQILCVAQNVRDLYLSQESNFPARIVRDEETGVMNKRYGLFVLENMTTHIDVQGGRLTLGYVEAAAEGLKSTAKVLQLSVRNMDTIARWDENAFILILPGPLVDTSSAVSRRIDGRDSSILYGFAEYSEDEDLSAEDLINLAREKMNLYRKSKDSL